MRSARNLHLLAVVAASLLLACGSSEGPARGPGLAPSGPLGTDEGGAMVGEQPAEAGVAQGAKDAAVAGADGAPPDIARSTRSSLQWKRYAALQNDLSQALDLPKAELCNEFGSEPCIDKVHLLPLGGHDPFSTGLLEPAADTLVTTGTVLERVVLSACLAKIEKERAMGKGSRVFELDLSGPAPAPDAAPTRAMITGLYRRFLARDATDEELSLVASLARDAAGMPVNATSFAATACMVVGTTTEFLFF
ncbi:MAG TPA: hypothetical protein VFZ61_20620 [Polyangiales bacterium]